jgi:hypothetical protein
MGRRRSVYLSDEVDAAITAAGLTLPEVIRRGLAITAATAGAATPDATARPRKGARSPVKDRQSRPSPEDCPHPRARVYKGLCGACGGNVSAA